MPVQQIVWRCLQKQVGHRLSQKFIISSYLNEIVILGPEEISSSSVLPISLLTIVAISSWCDLSHC